MSKKTIETILSFCVALVLAVGFRSFLFEPFHIPSGSMKPTLLAGDYIFVSKYSYGYSKYSFPFGYPLFKGRALSDHRPERGDVAVFRLPSQPSMNYIKRIIGIPGDVVQMKEGVLWLNRQEIPKEKVENFTAIEDGVWVTYPQYKETLPGGRSFYVLDTNPEGPLDNTTEYIIPKKHYFVMGDNRDNSQDSRIIDAVHLLPEDHLIGPARIIFFSTDASLFKIWEWVTKFRYHRFLKLLNQ